MKSLREKARLGGSALAQVYGQVGNESPDVDDPEMLKRAFHAIQKLISENLILAGHDISDGGLITTFLEMAFAGNCGLKIRMDGPWSPLERLFAEELGAVIECHVSDVRKVIEILDSFHLASTLIGETTEEKKILVTYHSQKVLESDMRVLREWWEETSYQIERLQMNPQCADEETKEYLRPQRSKLSSSLLNPNRRRRIFSKPKTNRRSPFSGKRGATAIAR